MVGTGNCFSPCQPLARAAMCVRCEEEQGDGQLAAIGVNPSIEGVDGRPQRRSRIA